MPLIRRKIAKRPPHGEDPPTPPTSEKCSKKALYTATKLYIIFQGGGRAPTLGSTVDAHAWGGGGGKLCFHNNSGSKLR